LETRSSISGVTVRRRLLTSNYARRDTLLSMIPKANRA
jgi:hypothetical protein